jgi:hypothetical protein
MGWCCYQYVIHKSIAAICYSEAKHEIFDAVIIGAKKNKALLAANGVGKSVDTKKSS